MDGLPSRAGLVGVVLVLALIYPVMVMLEGWLDVDVSDAVWLGIGAVATKLLDLAMEMQKLNRRIVELSYGVDEDDEEG